MEKVFESFFLFLMLLITIISVDLKIKEDLKEYERGFLFYHSIVELNYVCKNSTGYYYKADPDLAKRYCIKVINGSVYGNCSCLMICLPVVFEGKPAKICRCLK